MSWDDLRTVLAVARAGTLVGAATALEVNHTTVSRRLAAFESQLGVRLFDRTGQGLVPTASGEELLVAARRMEEEVLRAQARVLGRDAQLRGRVRLTTIDLYAVRYAALFTAFSQQYPEVDLEISTDARMANLGRREADVALRSTNRPDEHLVGRKVGTLQYAVYGARSLVEAVGQDAPLQDYPWISWDPRLDATLTMQWMARNMPRARIAAYLDTATVFLEMVRRGIGIAHLQVVDGEADPELVRLRGREPGFGMDLWLLVHPDMRHTARIRAFTAMVGEALAKQADAVEGTDLPWATDP
ncbi:MAG: LysR family transcriptional regulator [Myxococcales bacterium]|nr:LysR family transcriptional regulator [Myxococcales bacterium]